ncbi:MAG: hypothetical protein K2Y31_04190 [Burkholderiales bacterium]|jgi:hypothetical protein|nr:hypothetical protein [Burkholderiales bacterium]
MKKTILKSKPRTATKKSDKKAVAKLTKDYQKFFTAPQQAPGKFEIFTAYDYGTATEFSNHT